MKTRRNYPEPENARRIEIIILALYLFHTVSLFAAVLVMHWIGGALFPITIGAVACVYLCVTKNRTYAFRAYFTGIMLWMNLSIYALLTDDFITMLPTIAAAAALLALYCLPHIYRVGVLFFTAITLIHLLILRDLPVSADEKGMRTIMCILSIYFIQFLAYYLVRMQQESNLHLLENIESLRRAEQSKDDFMANVSHEIRTPVNTICGMSEIILQDELPPETRSYAYGIQIAGRNLLSLVSDILDFSELESGKISIVNDSYSITSVVNDIITTMNAKNSEKQLELVADCDPGMPETLIGDRQKICRAVINVLDNAIKFTQDGGIVLTIGTRREEYGANLCITVQDTGIGIRPETLEKIFTSFNQADTRRNRAESGIGLGLAISKAIVDKMGGFLKIDSVYGEGTSASIVIPQQIENDTPCIQVNHPQDVRILVYLHLEKYKFPLLREGSQTAITHMAERFDVTAFACRSLPEVKRRIKNDTITHLFIGWEEYLEAPAYFEEIASEMIVTLIVDRGRGQEIDDSRILCINAPLYALSVASILNGETVREMDVGMHQNHFTAPDAHILVVDDNLMNLKVVEGLLRPYQIKISVAGSGREALKKLESKAFDFVFMDHMMPEMDGVETFHHIREKHDSYYKNVPVIALTANAVGNAREMFLNEGFADYISKPIEMSALEHILRKFIPKEKMVYAGREIEIVRPRKNRDAKSADSASTGNEESMHGKDNVASASNGSESRPIHRQDAKNPPEKNGDMFANHLHSNSFVAGTTPSVNGLSAKTHANSGTDALIASGIDVKLGMTYCGGEFEDYLEIVRIYCSDGEKNIQCIREAFANRDWKTYVILTHTVKSTSKSIGAVALSDLAKELEAAGKILSSSTEKPGGNFSENPTDSDAKQNQKNLKQRTEEMLTEYNHILSALKTNTLVFPENSSTESISSTADPDIQGKQTSADAFSGTTDENGQFPDNRIFDKPSEPSSESGIPDGNTSLTRKEFASCCKVLAEKLDSFDSEAVLDFLNTVSDKTYQGQPLSDLFAPIHASAMDFDFIGAAEALEQITKCQ